MHFVDRIPIVHIAIVYGVHHVTVLRWLLAARERTLNAAFGPGEFDSIVTLLLSQLELSLSELLVNSR
jgi:hypothetical protein